MKAPITGTASSLPAGPACAATSALQRDSMSSARLASSSATCVAAIISPLPSPVSKLVKTSDRPAKAWLSSTLVRSSSEPVPSSGLRGSGLLTCQLTNSPWRSNLTE